MENKTRKNTSGKRGQQRTYASISAIAHHMHSTVARYCDYCGRAMSPSDVNDYGSLCESCYMKEYY